MVETDARTAPDQTIAEMNASVIATTMFWLLQPPGRPCYLRIDHRRGRSARRHSPSRVIVSSLTLHEVVKPQRMPYSYGGARSASMSIVPFDGSFRVR